MSLNIGSESAKPYVRDPLMDERALIMSGCHYVDGRHMTRERIDQIITKIKKDGQIPETVSVNTDLSRRAFVAGLKPIYEPFHNYVLHDLHGGKAPLGYYRHGRNPDDAVYNGLHEYLMEHHITEDDVWDYIKLCKENPSAKADYEQRRHFDMYHPMSKFKYPSSQSIYPLTRPLGDLSFDGSG